MNLLNEWSFMDICIYIYMISVFLRNKAFDDMKMVLCSLLATNENLYIIFFITKLVNLTYIFFCSSLITRSINDIVNGNGNGTINIFYDTNNYLKFLGYKKTYNIMVTIKQSVAIFQNFIVFHRPYRYIVCRRFQVIIELFSWFNFNNFYLRRWILFQF